MKISRNVPESRLYNAGDRIEEALLYSIEGHGQSGPLGCVARLQIVAPAKEFFRIAEMMEIKNDVGGTLPIYPGFTETLLREDRWGGRGVVLVDPTFDADDPEDKIPVAKSDKEAIAKANRILERYEKGIVQAFIDQCNEARAQGRPPVGAKGYTRKLLDKYGVADPSQAVLMKTGETQSEIEGLKKQMEEQQREFNRKLAELTATLASNGKESRAGR